MKTFMADVVSLLAPLWLVVWKREDWRWSHKSESYCFCMQ